MRTITAEEVKRRKRNGENIVRHIETELDKVYMNTGYRQVTISIDISSSDHRDVTDCLEDRGYHYKVTAIATDCLGDETMTLLITKNYS